MHLGMKAAAGVAAAATLALLAMGPATATGSYAVNESHSGSKATDASTWSSTGTIDSAGAFSLRVDAADSLPGVGEPTHGNTSLDAVRTVTLGPGRYTAQAVFRHLEGSAQWGLLGSSGVMVGIVAVCDRCLNTSIEAHSVLDTTLNLTEAHDDTDYSTDTFDVLETTEVRLIAQVRAGASSGRGTWSEYQTFPASALYGGNATVALTGVVESITVARAS
jgi:hypothetical protein